MTQSPITLSTNQLIAALNLCGYEKEAQSVGKQKEIKKLELDQILYGPDFIMQKSNLWDDETTVGISETIVSLIQNIVEAPKKIKFVQKGKSLNFYWINNNHIIMEKQLQKKHVFSFIYSLLGFEEEVTNFYKLDHGKNCVPQTKIGLSDSTYDSLHHMSSKALNKMIEDDSVEIQMKQFLQDFKDNGQEVIHVMFQNGHHLQTALSFIPGNRYCWLPDDQRESKEVHFVSAKLDDFLSLIENAKIELLKTEVSSYSPNKVKRTSLLKKFSVYRGLKSFIQANLFLALTYMMLLVSKQQWEPNTNQIAVYIFIFEIGALIVSFMACFRPRVYKD
ncbi:hypothetical protein [Priestia megaterium]|uniref:hypothetical protein n=1 Tax=Priestia megaterium TaxID=1404 RepID=UPI002E20268D|nr:hypothetical protein [Priestia megaterium]